MELKNADKVGFANQARMASMISLSLLIFSGQGLAYKPVFINLGADHTLTTRKHEKHGKDYVYKYIRRPLYVRACR